MTTAGILSTFFADESLAHSNTTTPGEADTSTNTPFSPGVIAGIIATGITTIALALGVYNCNIQRKATQIKALDIAQTDMLTAAKSDRWDRVLSILSKNKTNKTFDCYYSTDKDSPNNYNILHFAICHNVICKNIDGKEVHIIKAILAHPFETDNRLLIEVTGQMFSVSYLQFAYFKKKSADFLAEMLSTGKFTDDITSPINELTKSILQLALDDQNEEVYLALLQFKLSTLDSEAQLAFYNDVKRYLEINHNEIALKTLDTNIKHKIIAPPEPSEAYYSL